ncbi:MAG: hypothetical protein IT242_01200, partial [Bacteroidia bacterium]|nr:hypothetical protein [Bacteroidia bacterium]
MKIALRFLCILATGLQPVFAQDSRFILDNSFLIEEAYNQEPGVLQHIFLITADENSMDVEAGFTEELPLSGMNHQLSFTLSGATSDPRNFRINELLFNYRYQLVHTTQISIAPRFSTIIPFSDNRNYSNGWGF